MATFSPTAALQGVSSATVAVVVATLGISADLAGVGAGSVAASFEHFPTVAYVAQGSGSALFSEDLQLPPLLGVARGRLTVTMPPVNREMTLYRLLREIYAVWGIETTDLDGVAFWRSRAIAIVNGAFQVMFAQAHRLGFFNEQPVTVTVPVSGAVELPANVQAVKDPLTMGAGPLRKAETRGQFDNLADFYIGSDTPAAPLAYFLDTERKAALDSVGITLRVWPAPDGDTAATFDATLEPPRFDDTSIDAAEILPVPHKWVETILLPICKHTATGDSLFRRTDLKGEIDAQYARAQQILGLADPEKPKPAA